MTNTFECDKCGTLVRWTVSKAGNRYIEDISAAYDNGARYGRGPHFKTCDRRKAMRDEIAAANAEYAAKVADAEKRANIRTRWMNVYGEDIRAWAEVDNAAAMAHITAIMFR